MLLYSELKHGLHIQQRLTSLERRSADVQEKDFSCFFIPGTLPCRISESELHTDNGLHKLSEDSDSSEAFSGEPKIYPVRDDTSVKSTIDIENTMINKKSVRKWVISTLRHPLILYCTASFA